MDPLSEVDNGYGKMSMEYVIGTLVDFDMNIDIDSCEEIINKLNACSCVYRVKNSELLDSLVAFITNSKRELITLDVVDDFDRQVLMKRKPTQPSTSMAMSASRGSFSGAHQKPERAVLREIPMELLGIGNDDLDNDNNCPGDSNEECCLEDEFAAFDDDKQFKRPDSSNSNAGTTPSRKSWRNIKPSEVKSSWRGDKFTAAAITSASSHSPTNEETITTPKRGHSAMAIKPTLHIISSTDERAYRYGFDTIDDFDELELDEENVEEEEQLQREITLSGTIFPIDGRFLTFDNSYLFVKNRAYPLDLDKIEKLALFPGKRVTLTGTLTSDRVLQVQDFVNSAPLALAALEQSSQNTRRLTHLKVFVAYGPFSLSPGAELDDVFDQLLCQSIGEGANVLILIGPFVPKTAQPSPTHSFDSLFQMYFERVSQALQRANMRVLVIPNAQSDLCSSLYFPTPPYQQQKLAFCSSSSTNKTFHRDITFLPDPAVFELEGVRFAVSASEILAHLSKLELYKSGDIENEDRMSRLISHLFNAQSLYPMYPSDLNLSYNLGRQTKDHLKLTAIPHVLIAPSYLQPMVKIVDGSIVINPGRFVRGKAAGTYAVISVDLETATSNVLSVPSNSRSIAAHSEVSLLAANWK